MKIKNLATHLQKVGGQCYLIGGAVIDSILDRPIKDYDIEVYGLSMSELQAVLESLGLPCNMVGQSFGIIKTQLEEGEIDLSIPRRENKVGIKHTDFDVQLDPNMSPKEAGMRRDLTINSMYQCVLTGEIVDPFNGLEDLENGCIRATNPSTFIEDPLRVLRIMQLLPRKGKYVHPETIELCRSIKGEYIHLPKERVFEEWCKLLLKAPKPSLGLEFMRECGWIEHFPELFDLIGCPQNPEWHPEGDVWVHTCMVLDNAALLRDRLPEEKRLAYMFGALLHDIGKPATTVLPECTAHGHDTHGEGLALEFMGRITTNKELLKVVPAIVRYHMQPGSLHRAGAGDSAWKRLALKCDLEILGYISKADSAGRTDRSINDPHSPSEICFRWYNEVGNIIPALVMGRDLIALGYTPGPEFKILLDKAYQMQLDGMSKDDIILILK